MSAGNNAVIGVQPVPHLVENELKPTDRRSSNQEPSLNEASLVDYCECRIGTPELLARLRKLR